MTTKTKEANNEASRISKLSAAYRKHQPAIQSALKAREQVKQSAMQVDIASGLSGTQYRIGVYAGTYRILGVEQGRRLA